MGSRLSVAPNGTPGGSECVRIVDDASGGVSCPSVAQEDDMERCVWCDEDFDIDDWYDDGELMCEECGEATGKVCTTQCLLYHLETCGKEGS